MSIELENPKTLLEKIDAAANYVAQMEIAYKLKDGGRFYNAHKEAERLLFDATRMAEELETP